MWERAHSARQRCPNHLILHRLKPHHHFQRMAKAKGFSTARASRKPGPAELSIRGASATLGSGSAAARPCQPQSRGPKHRQSFEMKSSVRQSEHLSDTFQPSSDVAIGLHVTASLFRIGACESPEIALKGDVVRGGGSQTSLPFICDGRWAAGQPWRQAMRCVNAGWGVLKRRWDMNGKTLR